MNAEKIIFPAGSPGITLAMALAAIDATGQTGGWVPLFEGLAQGYKTEGLPDSSFPHDRYTVEAGGVRVDYDGYEAVLGVAS
jgi:hypothetical protein